MPARYHTGSTLDAAPRPPARRMKPLDQLVRLEGQSSLDLDRSVIRDRRWEASVSTSRRDRPRREPLDVVAAAPRPPLRPDGVPPRERGRALYIRSIIC